MQINHNFGKLQTSYLFRDIASKTAAYRADHPAADIISLGIGDVTRPLPAAVVSALHSAVDDMSCAETFQGYPPAFGYDFLLEAIRDGDFRSRGVEIETDEIFVNDGAKSDTANIGDLFGTDNVVAVCDPVYPVYVDANVMSGRGGRFVGDHWTRFVYLTCTPESDFLPALPSEHADILCLCFPNNPTGAAIDKAGLQQFVDWANEHDAVILFDAAYEAFITDDKPHSIYECDGAKTCAIEFRSFSKTAGFTGVRCGYTVVPKELVRDGASLNAMWARRQSTKFNGVPYITQRAAAAVYSPEGAAQCRETIAYYLNNARVIFDALTASGLKCWGAENSPYVWFQAPSGLTSWQLFDTLLHEAQVVGTPGSGFGPAGEGFFRLTAFNTLEKTQTAVARVQKLFSN
ncbi:MAG: LL-diaminopimelate aminotransferase [Oscillospiraceae bacterium]|jgi:LL-diaminopimelate aminotransferase|nr:LL-diaminopimelate aminotransferase [Oscillospiraceae bacterium]